MTPPDGSYQACIDAVKQTLGKDATDDQVEQVAESVQKRAKKLKAQDPLLSDADAALKAARELGDQAKLAALIEKRSRALNVLRKQERMARTTGKPNRAVRSYQEIMVGSQDEFYGSADSVDANAHGLEAELVGPMLAELRTAGLDQLIRRGGKDFERDVAREMFRLTNKEGVESGNKYAVDAAKIIAKYQEAARKLQNDAGAWIGKLDGYITRQSHDQYRIRKAGYEAWRNEIITRLDPKTFDEIDNPEKFLKKAYDGLSSGIHTTAQGEWLGGFKGPGNLAKRASQERVLHFKSADDWFDYNERFGTRDLFESILGTLQHGARNAAIMRKFGTNPEAAFVADMTQLAERARDAGDFKASDTFKAAAQKSGKLGRQFSVISGEVNIAGDVTWAQVGSVARSLLTMSKLGGVVLSSFPDIAVKASSLRHHGINYLEAVGDGFASVLRGRGSKEQREIADLIGVGLDGTLGSVFQRFGSHDTVPGRMSKLMNTFMKWNLLSYWTDAQATGVGLMLSRNLANNSKKAFAKLDPDLQRSLGRYGITPEDWDVARASEMRVADGGNFLTPDRITDAEVGRKFRSYLVDSTNEAMTMAGAYERAITTGGTQRGTLMGEALRYVMQFKSYGITFASRHIGRELRRKGHVDFTGLAALLVTSTAMGYVSMQAKELSKNRTPRTAEDLGGWAKIFTASMVQGGGLGIYGDFLFGQYNRVLGGGLETLLGPAAGEASDALKMLAKITSGQWEDLPADALRFAKDNTPFINLFYTRMGLDMLVLYDLQERMSPGYLRRMERKIKKDNGQRFILPPSSERATPFT
jgi:hypothetical protein